MTTFYSVRAVLKVNHNGKDRIPGDPSTQDFVVDSATKDLLFSQGRVTVNGPASQPLIDGTVPLIGQYQDGVLVGIEDPAVPGVNLLPSMLPTYRLQKTIRAYRSGRSNNSFTKGAMASAPALVQQAGALGGFTQSIAPNAAVFDLMGGSMSTDSSNGLVRIDGTKYQTNVTGGLYRTIFNGKKFGVQLKDNLALYRIKADGQWVSANYVDGTAGVVYASVDFGTYDSRLIEIEIRRNGGVKQLYCNAGEFFSAPIPRSSKIALIGDSQSADAVSDTAVPSNNDKWGINIFSAQLAEILDANVLNFAIPGTGYLAGSITLRNRLDEVIASAPDAVVIFLGTNDASLTPANVQAEAAYCYAAIKAQLPRTPVTIFGVGRSAFYSSNTSVEAAIAAAVAAVGNPLYAFRPFCTGANPLVTGSGNQGSPAGSGSGDILVGPDGTHFTLIMQGLLARYVADGCVSHWESLPV